MTAPVLAFFHLQSGIGQTTLIYRLAQTFADRGLRVLMVDKDPQCGLTYMTLKTLRHRGPRFNTQKISNKLCLMAGDPGLILDSWELEHVWYMRGDKTDIHLFADTIREIGIIRNVAGEEQADVVLVDLGPNGSALNRAILIGADWIVLSTQRNMVSNRHMYLAPIVLHKFRDEWAERAPNAPPHLLYPLPSGQCRIAGHVYVHPSCPEETFPFQNPERVDRCLGEVPYFCGPFNEAPIELKSAYQGVANNLWRLCAGNPVLV